MMLDNVVVVCVCVCVCVHVYMRVLGIVSVDKILRLMNTLL